MARPADDVRIRVGPVGSLGAYADIPIRFPVNERLEISLGTRPAEVSLESTVSVNPPWIKDYDASADHHPTAWPDRFDVSRWGLLTATRGEGKRPIGGAVLAFDTPGLEMLEGRSDLAMLWDLRVSPEERGRGAGSTLFAACERWARDRGGIELKIETQDINVPACRFYARQTCVLFEVHHDMYPEHPGETQLIWRKAL